MERRTKGKVHPPSKVNIKQRREKEKKKCRALISFQECPPHKTDGGSLFREQRGGLAKTAIAVFYRLNHSRFTAI